MRLRLMGSGDSTELPSVTLLEDRHGGIPVDLWLTYLAAFGVVMSMMTLLWLVSVRLSNASIVDPFWGLGFVLCAWTYALRTGWDELGPRAILVLCLATIWGLRLFLYLLWRNVGKGEDFRYQKFRRDFGAERYWWFSFFQVFLLQGVLMWLISAPLLGAQSGTDNTLSAWDALAAFVWLVGFVFEAGADWQLARFKANPDNKGRLLVGGFWKYTRHPNYFGDSAVWWGFGLFAIAAGQYWSVLGSLLMTALIVKVSGVALLEKTLHTDKPGYAEYVRTTSAFIPWFRRSTVR